MIVTRRTASKIRSRKTERIIFFDLETTGFNPYHCDIIEIAAVDSLGNTFSKFLHVDRIPPFIQKLTSITPEMLNTEGVSQKRGLAQFLEYINMYGNVYDVVMVAHNNIAFDSRFLDLKIRQFQLDELRHSGSPWTYFDSMHLSQLLLPRLHRHSMSSLCEYFNIVNEQAHRAIGDVRCLQKIFKALQVMYASRYHSSRLRDMMDRL